MDNCDAAVCAEQEISVVGGEIRRRMGCNREHLQINSNHQKLVGVYISSR